MSARILGYYEGSQTIRVMGTGDFVRVQNTRISANRPVLFIVSVDIKPFNVDHAEMVIIASWLGPSDTDYMYFKELKAAKGRRTSESITFASKSMEIAYLNTNAHFNIKWHIMVLGSTGTTVTVGR